MDLLKPSYASGYAKNASQSAHPNLWDGLVGAWMPSLGVTGDTLRDVSGNGNHGTLTNMDAASDWVATSKGLALDFDGSNDYVPCSRKINPKITGDLTFAVWANFERVSGVQGIMSTISASGNNGQQLEFGRTAGRFVWLQDGTTLDAISTESFSTGDHFVAITRTKVINNWQITFFIDNKPADQHVTSKNPAANGGLGNFTIGRPGDYNGQYFDGIVHSSVVYNRALSPQEIKQLYVDSLAPFRTKKRTVVRVPAAIPAATKVGSIKKPTTIIKPSYQAGYARNASESENPNLWDGLVGAWMPSLGVTGGTLRDVSGNGNHGTLYNMDAPTDWVATSKGLALDFDGFDDYVDCGRPSMGVGKLTVNAWIKLNAGNIFQHLVDSSSNSWHLALLNNNKPYFYNGATLHTLTETLSTNTWYMITGVQGSTLDLHVNGVLSQSISSNVNLTTNNIHIGRWQNGGRNFNGRMANISIYNRALSPTEIKQLYVDSLAPFRKKQRVSVAVPGAVTPTTAYHPLRSLAHPLEQ